MRLRLSEAIRLGSMLRPQTFYETRNAEGTCVLGAALDAVGITVGTYFSTCDVWPHMTQVAKHPVRGFDWMILSICRDLNDHCRWSRERIADWVESIEAQQPTQQEESCAIKL